MSFSGSREAGTGLDVAFAVAAVVLSHFVVPGARAVQPLLEDGALLAIVALGLWVMLVARSGTGLEEFPPLHGEGLTSELRDLTRPRP